MLPDFNSDGVLPEGIWLTDLTEIWEKFTYSYKIKGNQSYIQDLKMCVRV